MSEVIDLNTERDRKTKKQKEEKAQKNLDTLNIFLDIIAKNKAHKERKRKEMIAKNKRTLREYNIQIKGDK